MCVVHTYKYMPTHMLIYELPESKGAIENRFLLVAKKSNSVKFTMLLWKSQDVVAFLPSLTLRQNHLLSHTVCDSLLQPLAEVNIMACIMLKNCILFLILA